MNLPYCPNIRPRWGEHRGLSWKVLQGDSTFLVIRNVLPGSVATVDQPPTGSPWCRDQPAHVAAAVTVSDRRSIEARSAPAPAAVMPAATAVPAPAAMPVS